MINKKTIRLMFLGDLSGPPGVAMFQKWAAVLKERHKIDAIIVNGENATKNGRGITRQIVETLQEHGASVVTSGNHIWANKKVYDYINESEILIRPANFPSVCPGKGYTIFNINGLSIAIVNLQGRVFMHENIDCPFKAAETLLSLLINKTKLIFVDFHAEATSEKQALGHFLDGKVSGVYGTHTHVQTADEKILPCGTSYITDLGFAGAVYSTLGVKKEIIIERFLTQMPVQFKIEKTGPMVMTGIWVEINVETGKSLHIERIKIIDEEIQATL